MKILKILTMAVASLALAPAASAQQTAAIAPQDSLSVAIGTVLGDYIRNSVDHLTSLGAPVDNKVFIATMAKVLDGDPTGFTIDQANAWIDKYMYATRPADLPDAYSPESQEEFLKQTAALPGAVTTPSGLVFIVEQEGEGAMPTDDNRVKLKYKGQFYDGTVFDATGSPIEFKVTDVTPGFSEGLKMMKPSGRYRIVMPASLAYGPEGIPGAIPGNAALDFTVDLIGIVE